jgi:hypothetical protein
MSTKVYGASDDLVEFEGDIKGEVGAYGTDDDDKGVLLMFSDGTILEAKYGKLDSALWGITCHKPGSLYEYMETVVEETDKGHSDIAHFRDGLTWCYAATEWKRVR